MFLCSNLLTRAKLNRPKSMKNVTRSPHQTTPSTSTSGISKILQRPTKELVLNLLGATQLVHLQLLLRSSTLVTPSTQTYRHHYLGTIFLIMTPMPPILAMLVAINPIRPGMEQKLPESLVQRPTMASALPASINSPRYNTFEFWGHAAVTRAMRSKRFAGQQVYQLMASNLTPRQPVSLI